jgi:hypothetical protein
MNTTQTTSRVDTAMKDASIRSMRILHVVFLAAIVGYLYVAERIFVHTKPVPIVIPEAFALVSAAVIIIALVFRRRLLAPAIEALRHDGKDATALAQWRSANTLSMILAMSVSLDGLALPLWVVAVKSFGRFSSCR